MRAVKYLGSRMYIGRFGMLSTNDHILMYEEEFTAMEPFHRVQFELLPEAPLQYVDPKVVPVPTTGGEYDLTTIDWKKDNLFSILNTRTSRLVLLRVWRAMLAAGVVAPRMLPAFAQKREIADAICELARRLGWRGDSKQQQEQSSSGSQLTPTEQNDTVRKGVGRKGRAKPPTLPLT